MDEKLKALMDVVLKDVDADERIIRFTGSTDSVDRDNEVIEADAWNIKNYKKNPVFLLAHDYRDLPIGKAVNVEKGEKGLEFDIKFPDRETYPLADTVYRLYKGGFMNAVSVGFRPNYEKRDIIDNVPHYKDVELLELSAVSVPANPEAVMQRMFDAEKKGVVNRQEVMELTLAAKSFFSAMKKDAKPEPEMKSGRVLSKANEKLLRGAVEDIGKAAETIAKVLDKVIVAEPAPEVPVEEPKAAKVPDFKSIYNSEFFRKDHEHKACECLDPEMIKKFKGDK